MAKLESINNFPVQLNCSFASSCCLMSDHAGSKIYLSLIIKKTNIHMHSKLLFLFAGLFFNFILKAMFEYRFSSAFIKILT